MSDSPRRGPPEMTPEEHRELIRNEEGFTISNRVSIPRVAARIVRERLGLDDGSRDG